MDCEFMRKILVGKLQRTEGCREVRERVVRCWNSTTDHAGPDRTSCSLSVIKAMDSGLFAEHEM